MIAGRVESVEGRGFPDHPDFPFGPPPKLGPKETPFMRVLPNVHEALRQNDPSMAPGSQPVLKKAPPSTGRPRPKGFYSESEPPRIGTAPVQHPPPPKPPASRYADSYSHESRQSTSSTYRGAFKANARRDESGDTQASIASAGPTGSAQQASTTQGISTWSTASSDNVYGVTFSS